MSFKAIQQQFTALVRDQDANATLEGIEPRRMKIYQELMYNNVKGFLDSGFPVLKSVYEPGNWERLCKQFFSQHACRSPYFVDISKEFVEFLANEYDASDADDPAFLQELAHYEWLELAISVKHRESEPVVWHAEELPDVVCMSDVAVLAGYSFPVHQISPEFQPQQPTGPVFLVVYRNAEDDVNFMLVNEVTASLLQRIESSESGAGVTYLEQEMTQSMPGVDAEHIKSGLHQILSMLLENGILYPCTADT